jgi:hypothetical protein
MMKFGLLLNLKSTKHCLGQSQGQDQDEDQGQGNTNGKDFRARGVSREGLIHTVIPIVAVSGDARMFKSEQLQPRQSRSRFRDLRF